MIVVPLRTRGSNAREPWQARHRRVRGERQSVAWMLAGKQRPSIPCTVLLTRCAQSGGLDDDNLRHALKGVRDEVARWLGVNDRNSAQVRYAYAQIRGDWAVRIEFGPPASGAQLELLGEVVMPRAAA
ncbi:MAG TPA: hypothetical protein VJO99_09275 [Burkholderiaceae bacterium]|nr:hypothetical protein [Burkholderiaceae bacterium]